MTRYVIRRLLQIPFPILAISVIVFVVLRMTGDPVDLYLPIEATLEQRAQLRQDLGLNDPVHVQYYRYLADAAHGDFGTSLRYRRPAINLVAERFPATIQLALAGMTLSVILGVGLGVLAAVRKGSATDYLLMGLAIFSQSMPGFWLGIILIMIFAVMLRVLPTSGMGDWRYLAMPALTVASYQFPQIMLLVRSSMLETINDDFVRVARAKGLRESLIIRRHVLPNILSPVVTSIGLQFGRLMGGAVITETVFAWPGVGQFAVQGVFNRDFPVVQSAIVMIALLIILSNFAADLVNAALDPRIRQAQLAAS